MLRNKLLNNKSIIIKIVYCVAGAGSELFQCEGCISPKTEISILHEPHILFFSHVVVLIVAGCAVDTNNTFGDFQFKI